MVIDSVLMRHFASGIDICVDRVYLEFAVNVQGQWKRCQLIAIKNTGSRIIVRASKSLPAQYCQYTAIQQRHVNIIDSTVRHLQVPDSFYQPCDLVWESLPQVVFLKISLLDLYLDI